MLGIMPKLTHQRGVSMAPTKTTKLKLAASSFQVEYEGSEGFLQSEMPKWVQAMDKLQGSRLVIPLQTLRQTIGDSLTTQKAASDLIASAKSDLDSLSELGETESLRLQMAMDRLSKLMTTLSNMLKKMDDTAVGIVQNLK
jgi:hypothetical protein